MEEMSLSTFSRRVLLAFLGSAAGAQCAALVISGYEALVFGVPFLSSLGLLFPASLLAALLVAPWMGMIHRKPGETPILQGKRARLRLLLLAPLAILLWWLLGYLALQLLVAFGQRAERGGLLMAVTALGCLVALSKGVELGARWLSQRANPPERWKSVGLAFAVMALLVGLSILVGTKSGTGAPLSLFGVFKREELNLVPATTFLVLLASGYAVASLVTRRLRWAGLGALFLVFSATGILGLFVAASMNFSAVLSFERSRGLTATSLRLLQGASDWDGDGYGRFFGGGDCDDANPEIAPGTPDLPGNGVDEDCSGADRVAPSREEQEPPEPAPSQEGTLPENPNFLLLTIDTLRFDLGYTGAAPRENLSPEIDELAARSTVFESAYALASYTSKSLGPMMIGRYPSETARTFEHFDRFSDQVPFVQERLRDAGIHTLSVQGYWYFFFKSYGFERGWDELDSSSAPRVIAIEGDRTINGDKVADVLIAQFPKLAAAKRPFFAWAHWVDPHAEYVAHEEFDYGSEQRERYDGEVSFVDAQVGRVLDALSQSGLAKNTVILLTSDHGEAFGEHGMIRHGFEVWEELVRIPMILHVPGVDPRTVKERRSLIDVAPTILGTFDVAQPEGEDFMRGTSLLRDALSAKDAELAQRPVLVDMPKGPHNRERRAFYSKDMKLITSAGRVIGLYDLKKDPQEKNDLSENEELVSAMKNELEEFLAGLEEVPAR